MAQGVGEQVILMAPSNLSTNKSSTGDRLSGNILVSPVLFTCQVCKVSVVLHRELLDAGGEGRERGEGERKGERGRVMDAGEASRDTKLSRIVLRKIICEK